MSQEIEAKLDVLKQLITTIGKITTVQIRLDLAGEHSLSKMMDTQLLTLQRRVGELKDDLSNPSVLYQDWGGGALKLQHEITDI